MPLTKFQRLMLINAQPVKFWLNLLGGALALYFLWRHELVYALIFAGPIIFAGTLLASRYAGWTPEEMAKTRIGIAFLRYATTFGFTCYLISHTLIPLAFWLHSFILMGVGLLFLMLGLIKKQNEKTEA